jgi:hypothetical protein
MLVRLKVRAGLCCVLILLGLFLISWQTSAIVGSNSSSAVPGVVADTDFNYSLGTKGNQIFFSEGYWFVFYYNGSDIVCSDGAILFKTSQDGENWSDPQIAADDANISVYFSVYQFNETVVVAYSSMQALSSDSFFDCVVRTRAGNMSSTSIAWETPVILLSGPEIGGRICCYWGDYAFDKHWLAIEYLCGGTDYRCAIFSTTDFVAWNLSKDWINANGGYVSQVTLRFVENSRLMALYGSWAGSEFNYMFYNGSDWSNEYVTSGASLESGLYKAQCEVVINGTMYMLYSHWDYITDLKLGVYNGSWYFSDFLPEDRYWGGDSSVTFDRTTNRTYFFYIDAETNQVLAAYTTDFVDWVKDLQVDAANSEYIRRTRTSKFCDGSPAVAWIVGSEMPFHIRFGLLDPPARTSTTMSTSLTLLGGGARWAAGNGTSALYIDWKDNWLTHHLTDGVSWGPWPQEAEMDNWSTSVSQALTENGFDVHLAGDIPDDLSGYDLLVLQAYWAAEPRLEPVIRQFISNGGGLVVLQGAAEYLRCYCKDWWTYVCPPDPASVLVSEWLGSDTYVNTGGWAHVSVDNPFGTSLVTGDALIATSGYSNAAICNLHADSQTEATWDSGLIFGYTHEFGSGRVYYQATYSDVTPSALPPPPPPPPLPQDNGAVVRIEPENVIAKKDEVFTVNVTIENVSANPGIAGIQFTMTWDPAILTALKLTDVVFHEVTPLTEYDNIWQLENTISQGQANYAYTWQDAGRAQAGGYLPISGNHTVATIEFKAVNEGATTLRLSTLKVADPNSEPLNYASPAGVSTVNVVERVFAAIDSDGKVDLYDALVMANHFGCRIGDTNWDGSVDMNADHQIDIYDVIIFAAAFRAE